MRVVGGFPDGQSALMLVAARLRHITATKWGTLCHLTTELLHTPKHQRQAAQKLRLRLHRSESAKDSGHNPIRHAIATFQSASPLQHVDLNLQPPLCWGEGAFATPYFSLQLTCSDICQNAPVSLSAVET